MQIVLPGALPDADSARALEPHVKHAAPSLQRWRARARVRVTPAPTAQAGCTAYEQWQLTRRGFAPEAKQNLSAGLGALLAGATAAPDEPVWLAELVHIALGSDGAALIPARRLDVSMQDSQALLVSAQDVCAGSGFVLQPHSATHWRVMPAPDGCADPKMHAASTVMEGLRCASPELVATSSVHDWWPQDAAARAWRRVFNAVQMRWFDHPVNHARAARNLPPINGLWLFGGARPAQLLPGSVSPAPVQVIETLYDPWLQQDWGAWLQALADLERTVFAPLACAPDALVLIGREEIAEFRLASAMARLWRWFA